MYEHKAGRASASRQSSDVLLKVLSERNSDLREHGTGVASMAMQIAEQLGLPASEVKIVGLAAELHDVGKTAIPDAILNKPGPLNDSEWEFMRQHTVIGERILLAAPSLAPTAELVRSSHEAFDGKGYPGRAARRGDPARFQDHRRLRRLRRHDLRSRLPRRDGARGSDRGVAPLCRHASSTHASLRSSARSPTTMSCLCVPGR